MPPRRVATGQDATPRHALRSWADVKAAREITFMTRPRPGIGSELLPVLLILVSLAGTWSLVVTMHRRVVPARPPDPAPAPTPAQPVAVAPRPPEPPTVVVAPAPPPPPTPPKPVEPPPEDPTEKALAKLSAARDEQRAEAQGADRKAEALETARQAALAELERARRREMLVR